MQRRGSARLSWSVSETRRRFKWGSRAGGHVLGACAQVDGHEMGGAGGHREGLATGGAAVAAGFGDQSQRGVLDGVVGDSIKVVAQEQIGVVAVWEGQRMAAEYIRQTFMLCQQR